MTRTTTPQKRHRSGYDAEAGQLLRRQGTVSAFVESEDPVQVLSDHSELVFDAGCVVCCVCSCTRLCFAVGARWVPHWIASRMPTAIQPQQTQLPAVPRAQAHDGGDQGLPRRPQGVFVLVACDGLDDTVARYTERTK